MRKLRIALMAVVATGGGFLLGSILTFELQTPEIITETVEAVAPPPARIEISPIVLVNAMESTFESTTFSMNMTIDEVKAGKCDGNILQDVLYRDCLLMKVPGEIKAGFGREILDPKRFTSTTDTLTVDLGTPVIYRPNIIHTRVKVLNPKDDGGYWSDPDKNLQAKGFVEAEKRLRKAACQAGILKSAVLSAEKEYGDLFRNVLKAAGDVRTVKIVANIPDCTTVL